MATLIRRGANAAAQQLGTQPQPPVDRAKKAKAAGQKAAMMKPMGGIGG
jgi:hypothetical protein